MRDYRWESASLGYCVHQRHISNNKRAAQVEGDPDEPQPSQSPNKFEVLQTGKSLPVDIPPECAAVGSNIKSNAVLALDDTLYCPLL